MLAGLRSRPGRAGRRHGRSPRRRPSGEPLVPLTRARCRKLFAAGCGSGGTTSRSAVNTVLAWSPALRCRCCCCSASLPRLRC
ncbi:hypothetical protein HBB16_18560 [Pseudonocardia sp. MCCB 268]|nr:hypothetical protein [Pseudonocardia cytotoxica]